MTKVVTSIHTTTGGLSEVENSTLLIGDMLKNNLLDDLSVSLSPSLGKKLKPGIIFSTKNVVGIHFHDNYYRVITV